MEDLLTSDVFGCLRYLPPQTGLLPFLLTARSVQGREFKLIPGISKVHSLFWPWLNFKGRSSCEPDVLLGLEDDQGRMHLVMIEAKYHSGISSEADEGEDPRHQLARELDTLRAVTGPIFGLDKATIIGSRTLIFVTADMAMPRADMLSGLAEFAANREEEAEIFWTSWRQLIAVLKHALTNEIDDGRQWVLDEDMLALLARKGLFMFSGVERVTRRFSPTEFEFYYTERPSYVWPDILDPGPTLREYVYEVTANG
jgi:hypothetical protein